jgi:hypothetical protein
MPKFSFPLAIVAAAALALGSTAAYALNARSWVASNGSDAADCSRATPCATFFNALPKTNAGGEITCVDSGNFGTVNIDKSITINCEGVLASNSASSSLGVFFVTTAAADRVILRGLDIDLGSGDGFGAVIFNCGHPRARSHEDH